jgi:hypothetical protein
MIWAPPTTRSEQLAETRNRQQLFGPDKSSPLITERNRARSSRRSEGSRSSALRRPGHDGAGKRLRHIGINGCRRLPVWLPHGEPACDPYPGPRFTLVSAHPPSSISDESDCLRAVTHQNGSIFEYEELPALSVPRPRLERGTYCSGGTFEVLPCSARCRLTCCLAAAVAAGCGLVQLWICGRRLLVWLP